MNSLEEALNLDKKRNDNSFYDVFEKCSEKEIFYYQQAVGMPTVTVSIDEAKKALRN